MSAPAWGQYGNPYPQGPRTNPLAIVSLVAGCVQPFLWIIGSIAAIVTGHIARSQIKRTGEKGEGMALAGLILGYIGLAAGVALFVMLFVLAAAAPTIIGQAESAIARSEARSFAHTVNTVAQERSTTPRDAAVIRTAVSETPLRSTTDEFHLPDGTPVDIATNADYARTGWRVELNKNSGLSGNAECITIPATATGVVSVVDGPCH